MKKALGLMFLVAWVLAFSGCTQVVKKPDGKVVTSCLGTTQACERSSMK